MTQQLAPEDITVVCHIRPSLVLDPVDAKIETLQSCEGQDEIDSLLVRSWPAEVSLGDGGPYHEVVERFERFEEWADRHGVDIRPPFRIRTSTSIASDKRTETLLTPGICLALYHQDHLHCVVPHTDGETTYTVSETIASLRTGSLPAPLESVSPVKSPHEPIVRGRSGTTTTQGERDRTVSSLDPTCPDCGGTVANVQGMLTCSSCEWTKARSRSPLASR
jgi:hypothetical protein